ncbi:hypothetical protein HaLaN_30619, partial [Haematococcus lacustris]
MPELQPHRDASAALGVLDEVLRSSLGPLGSDQLVVNELQQVLCTASGADMLGELHARHGDGSKRVVLAVAAGLRAALAGDGA